MKMFKRVVFLLTATALGCGMLPASAATTITTERQTYHFTPPINWASDPNGLVYVNGVWHMFYQNMHNLDGIGPVEWGHATSTDLLNWTHQPLAIGNDDKLGAIFSGSAVYDKNNTSGLFPKGKGGIVAIYTNNGSCQQQSIAYSTDGINFTKYAGNPVIPFKDDPLQKGDFRDPKVFWHEESNQWMMIVAGGPVRFYSSKNLIDWKQEGNNPEIVTECPDIFKMTIEGSSETRWVINEGGRYYRIGDFKQVDGKWKFVEDKSNPGRRVLNFGNDAYAAQTFNHTPDGRILMLQWMSTWQYATLMGQMAPGYNGTYTLVTELSLARTSNGGELALRQRPAKEYETLRDTANKKALTTTLTPGGANPLADWSGKAYEMIVEFTPSARTTEFGFKLRSGSGRAFTLSYNTRSDTVTFDRIGAGKTVDTFERTYTGTLLPSADGKVRMQIFVDSTSVELYGNEGLCTGSSLVFPDASQTGIEAYTKGGNVEMNITMYPLNAIDASLDKSELKDTIAEANALNLDGCAENVKNRFTQRLTQANTIYNSKTATRVQIDLACNNLRNAINDVKKSQAATSAPTESSSAPVSSAPTGSETASTAPAASDGSTGSETASAVSTVSDGQAGTTPNGNRTGLIAGIAGGVAAVVAAGAATTVALVRRKKKSA